MLQRLLDGVLRKAARHSCTKPFVMRNAAPLVSFTFDDVPASAYHNGAAVLDEYGVQGTFYIAAGILADMDRHWRVIDRAELRALYQRGHEIGCHTYSHVGVDTLDAPALDEECRHNREVLETLCPGVELTNFCYPYGRVSLPRKLELQRRFDSCRGIYQGINSGTIDLALLRVVELYDRTLTAKKLDRLLRETRECNGWLIFYTHDVAPTPSWIGCSPALLRDTLAAAQAQTMRCLPVRAALTDLGYRRETDNAAAISAGAASATL